MGRAAWHGFVCFYRSNDLTFASSVAFYALLSLFPFLLLSLSVLGQVSADDHDRAAILGFVLQYFPRQFDFVTVQLDAFRQSKTALSLGSSVIMVWAALGFFGAITSAINYAFQVKPFGYWQHKLVSFLMLAAASLLMLAGLILLSARTVLLSRWFAGAADAPADVRLAGQLPRRVAVEPDLHRRRRPPLLLRAQRTRPLPRRLAGRDRHRRAVAAGAEGFGWYVRDLSRFSVHGSVAAVVVFLMWVYVSAVILIYGVEFTVAYARLRRGMPEEKMPVDAIEPGTEVDPEAAPSAESVAGG